MRKDKKGGRKGEEEKRGPERVRDREEKYSTTLK